MDKYEKELWEMLEKEVKKTSKVEKKDTDSLCDLDRWKEIQEETGNIERELEDAINIKDNIINKLYKKEIDSQNNEDLYAVINACKSKIFLLKEYQYVSDKYSLEEFKFIEEQIIDTYKIAIECFDKLDNIPEIPKDTIKSKKDKLHLLMAEYYESCQSRLITHQQVRKNDEFGNTPQALLCVLDYGKKVLNMLSKIEKPIEIPMVNMSYPFKHSYPDIKSIDEIKERSTEDTGIYKINIPPEKIIDKKINYKTGKEIILFAADMVQTVKYDSLYMNMESLIKIGKNKDAKKIFEEMKLIDKGYNYTTKSSVAENEKFTDVIKFFNRHLSKSSCFVATVVYNTPYSDEVLFLSLWRDRYLKNNIYGNIFIGIYYKIGPILAKIVSKSKILKKITGCFINFLIKIIKIAYPK